MSASTARPLNGRSAVHEQGDYPILIGDSLKHESSSQLQFLRLRYNWEPQDGLKRQRGILKRSNGQTLLKYRDDKSDSSTYDYNATLTRAGDDEDGSQLSRLALVFDAKKSAYVLEQISQSFDLNLVSAHDQSSDKVRQHKQISTVASTGERENGTNGGQDTGEDDEDEADASNPFDFRHFLTEARENAEKATQPSGNRTPIPGSRTPISGISSPSLGAKSLLSTSTPQFRPTPRSAPAPNKAASTKVATSTAPRKQATTRRKPAASKPSMSQPLSSEVVSSSSDDDTQNTITVSQASMSLPKDRGHNRNASSISATRSPTIVVDGVLEIDLGSPPPETRRNMIDLDAFRSQTHTPTLGNSSNKPPPPRSQRDIEMRDASDDEDDEDDEEPVLYHRSEHHNDDAGMDTDVDALDLGSPRSEKHENKKDVLEEEPLAPTPLPAGQADEDDLEAELEAAMMGVEEEGGGGGGDDDESEVSEEE